MAFWTWMYVRLDVSRRRFRSSIAKGRAVVEAREGRARPRYDGPGMLADFVLVVGDGAHGGSALREGVLEDRI